VASDEPTTPAGPAPDGRGDPESESPGLVARVTEGRRRLQEALAVAPFAYSAAGPAFEFRAPVGSGLRIGGYVRLEPGLGEPPGGEVLLGQVTSCEVVERSGPELQLAVDADVLGPDTFQVASATARPAVRELYGTGTVLGARRGDALVPEDARAGFAERAVAPPAAADLAAYTEMVSGPHGLTVGRVGTANPAGPVRLDPRGFARHTFVCGQSGSGKTYSLGVLLEQLLLATTLPLVIIDPNGDFTRLTELRPSTAGGDGLADRWTSAMATTAVFTGARAPGPGVAPLRIDLSDLAEAEQAALLQIDPVADRHEYHLYSRAVAALGDRAYSVADVRAQVGALDQSPTADDLLVRMENLGLEDWSLWAGPGEASAAVVAASGSARVTVIDVGGLDTALQKVTVATGVLGRLWRQRARRRPVLVVMDEAHNVCPAEPEDPVTRFATEHAVTIAGEGRKFGLYLLVATQRPQKVHENVVSQCDNLMLMRMSSAGDLAVLQRIFSQVPPAMLQAAAEFAQGEALLAGRITRHPVMARMGERVTEEGGSDPPTDWAVPPVPVAESPAG
jgi:hypothetical protein